MLSEEDPVKTLKEYRQTKKPNQRRVMDVLKGSTAGNKNYGFVGWGQGSDPIPAEFKLPIKDTPYV